MRVYYLLIINDENIKIKELKIEFMTHTNLFCL